MPFNGMLLCNLKKKFEPTNIGSDMDESQYHYDEWKKPDIYYVNLVRLISKTGKC